MSAVPSENLLAQARQLIRLRRSEQAVALLVQAIAADPADPRPHQLLAQCLIHLGRHAEGLREANAAISLDPENEWSFRLRSIALLSLGKGSLRPSVGPSAYLGRRKRRQGLAAAREAVRLAPSAAAPLMQLSSAYLANNNPFEGVTAAEEAVRRSPSSADAYNILGLAALRVGRVKGAEAAFRKTLQIDPQHAAALNNMGLVARAVGRPREAPELFGASARADPRLVGAKNAARMSNTLFGEALITAFLICVLLALRAVGLADKEPFWWLVAAVAGAAAYAALRVWRAVRDTYRPGLLEFAVRLSGRLVGLGIVILGGVAGVVVTGSVLGALVAIWPLTLAVGALGRSRARKNPHEGPGLLHRKLVFGAFILLSALSFTVALFGALPAFVDARPGNEMGPLLGFAVGTGLGIVFAIGARVALRVIQWQRHGGAPLLEELVAAARVERTEPDD